MRPIGLAATVGVCLLAGCGSGSVSTRSASNGSGLPLPTVDRTGATPPICAPETSVLGSASVSPTSYFLCMASGAPTTTTTPVLISLPPPNNSGPSTLQIRPVLKTYRGTCAPARMNPAPDQPVTLAELQTGQCFDMGASQLTVTRAVVEPEPGQSPLGGIDLRMTLGTADAAGLNRLAAADYQGQVAIVTFGKVITAPTVNATQFSATIVVSGPNGGMDPETAANIKAALAG
jgi:hypothetical protein